jgi:hypothetical protein
MGYVVHGVPLAKIQPIDLYAKEVLQSYPSRAAAVKAIINGAEDSSMQILSDG